MKRFFGGLLVAIGILIAGLSGLCTLVFFVGSFSSVREMTHPFAVVLSDLAFGGVPFLIGVGLILAGRALLKQP